MVEPIARKFPPTTYIYFIRQKKRNGAYKIGFAKSVKKRLKQLQCGSPDRLVVMGVEIGGRGRERELHYQFGDLQLCGEWFLPNDELWDHVRRLPKIEWK